MKLGRVCGTVVATHRQEGLEGIKMMIVQPLDRDQNEAGAKIVCADATAQAGPGELVLWEGGREAAMALPTTFVAVDHSIIAIVDQVETSS